MANNIITAAYSSSNITYTKPAYQYDYGMILKFSGIELPHAYEVHFSNTEFCGESVSQIGDENGVTIPDSMFLTGNPIYAWVYLHTGEDDGETVYKAVIAVNKRAEPSNIEPTPVQQDVITQAIAALNSAVTQTAQDVVDANAAKDAAELAQGKAEDAQEAAEIAQGKAEDAQEAAETAQGKAEDAQAEAERAAENVHTYAERAETAAGQAEGYAQTASDKASEASGYASDAQRYSESASSFASDAQASSEASYLSAQSSSRYASDASGYASSAYESAQNASGSASDASSAKDLAVQAKNDAISAKNDAVSAKNDAVQAKNDASGFATNASNSASEASGYADDAEASADRAEQAVQNCPNIYGTYDGMTVGQAKQIVTDEGTEDNGVYLFRESGGGNRETDMIVGGTVAWNQLATPSSQGTVNDVIHTPNADGSTTYNGTTSDSGILGGFSLTNTISGHKYLISPSGSALSQRMSAYTNIGGNASFSTSTIRSETITSASRTVSGRANSGVTFTNAVLFIMVVDLTQMFGSTIADYLYTLESGTAGSGISKTKSWGYFLKDYYSYNSGELMSVQTSAHVMRGFNQWDEEWANGYWAYNQGGAFVSNSNYVACKNKIKVLPNTTYFWQTPSVIRELLFYDADENYISRWTAGANPPTTFTTPSNCYFITFYMGTPYGNVYNHDICINLSGSRNGEYEPYSVHSYPLDSDLVLRGIPKQDASGNLYYYGDVYHSDGTVDRKFAVVDLGTLNWSYDSGGAFFSASKPSDAKSGVSNDIGNIKCDCYPTSARTGQTDKTIAISPNYLFVVDSSYTDSQIFTTAMSGHYLVYELRNPNSEQADPFAQYQIVDADGTEEYVDARTVPIPVGHQTKYLVDVVKKIMDAPDSPTTDGTYILEREDGENEYISFDPSDYVTDSELTTALADKADKTELNDKADIITSSASGEIVTISDGANNLPVKNLSVSLLPVQSGSGDPSPSNVRPISGWTGVEVYQRNANLCALPVLAQSQVAVNKSNCFFIKKGTYYLSLSSPTNCTSARACVYMFNKNGTALLDSAHKPNPNFSSTGTYWRHGSDASFSIYHVLTFIEDCYIRIAIGVGDVVSTSKANGMLCVGYFSKYVPYVGTTIPIDWTSTAGTVYGGSLDLTTGKLVAKYVKQTVTSINGVTAANGYGVSTIGSYGSVVGTTTDPFACSNLLQRTTGSASAMDLGYFSVFNSVGNNDARLAIKLDVEYGSTTTETKTAYNAKLSEWANDGNPLEIVYQLTTPLEYTLTETQIATFLGVNNFWSNSNGQIDLEYRADTKLYIEQLTKPTEDDMTANANIPSDSFFMVGNRLFLSSVGIGQGQAIVPGANCFEISLADALNQLNS